MRHDDLHIGARSVHVWIARLPSLSLQLGDRRALLSESELRRADRFRDAPSRERYLTVHILYRLLMAQYLELPPSAVEYRTGPLGAPMPVHSSGGIGFRWSLSYREEYAVFAVSAAGPVGVDIERIRPDAAPALADHCLGSSEREAVRALPEDDRTTRIFQLWTVKEAVLKRAGIGLSVPPSEVRVELADINRPTIVLEKARGEELSAVSVRVVDAPEGYVCSVAADPELRELIVRPVQADLFDRADC